MARPSKFSARIADEICRRLSEGESLTQICAGDDMPDRATVIRWRAKHPDFAAQCACAREEQAEVMDERILSAATRCEAGALDPHAAKVAISAYQWRAAKLKPKVYGDKITQEHTGEGGGPVVTEIRIVGIDVSGDD